MKPEHKITDGHMSPIYYNKEKHELTFENVSQEIAQNITRMLNTNLHLQVLSSEKKQNTKLLNLSDLGFVGTKKFNRNLKMSKDVMLLIEQLDYDMIITQLNADPVPDEKLKFDCYVMDKMVKMLIQIKEATLHNNDKRCTFSDYTAAFADVGIVSCSVCNTYHSKRNKNEFTLISKEGYVAGFVSTLEQAQKICKEKNWSISKDD